MPGWRFRHVELADTACRRDVDRALQNAHIAFMKNHDGYMPRTGRKRKGELLSSLHASGYEKPPPCERRGGCQQKGKPHAGCMHVMPSAFDGEAMVVTSMAFTSSFATPGMFSLFRRGGGSDDDCIGCHHNDSISLMAVLMSSMPRRSRIHCSGMPFVPPIP